MLSARVWRQSKQVHEVICFPPPRAGRLLAGPRHISMDHASPRGERDTLYFLPPPKRDAIGLTCEI